MKKNFLFFAFLISVILMYSQESDTLFKNSKGFSHTLNSYEKELYKNYDRSFQETNPPTGQVRNIAEWEQMESVIVGYDDGFGIPYSLIQQMAEYCNVTILVANSSEENSVRTTLTNNGVNVDNCTFYYEDVDSWWSRDYSPWWIVVDNQTVSLVDFPYNRPRPNDDNTPSLIATQLNVPYYGMNVTHTGGNYMCDGYGQAVSTDLVIEENSSLTEEQIRQKMEAYLGITNYHITADPLDDYIKHVDCWGKYLDVDKILIAQVPENDYRYNDFEAVAAYFENTNCSYGYPYKVYRVYEPSLDETVPYTNSLILNGKVFVPQTGSQWDDDAIAVYEQAMPGYEIIGVTAGSASWYNTDALHCRTHGIADREMLFVQHYPVFDTVAGLDSVVISANVYSYGNHDLKAGYPKLFYKINDSVFHSVEMINTDTSNYQAKIPVYNDTNVVSYYIEAQDVTDRVAKNPIMGENDPHIFVAVGGNQAVLHKAEKRLIAKIYPNPNNGRFFIWVTPEKTQQVAISIFSMSGQEVFSTYADVVEQGQLVEIDAANLQSGIYFIKINTSDNMVIRKLIVQ